MANKVGYGVDTTLTSGQMGPITDSDVLIDVAALERTSSGTADLWTDAYTTSIVIGGGTNQTTLTLGKAGQNTNVLGSLVIAQDLTVNGTTTTISTTNLAVEDALILLNNGGAGTDGGIAIERGGTGDDAVILWEEGNTRYELGLADTSGGTVVPASLTTFVDLKLNNLLLDGTAITADGALTVTATGAALTLEATSTNEIQLTTNGTPQWSITSGGDLICDTDGGNDIGAAGATRPANVHVATSVVVATNVTISSAAVSGTGALTIQSGGSSPLSLDSANAVIETNATSITADAALTLTATGASSDLTFGARSATVTLNQSGATSLAGFTATSIVGALNELKQLEMFMEFGVFDIITTADVWADTYQDVSANFQVWDKIWSTVASGRVDVWYEGRLPTTVTGINEIKIPVLSSAGPAQLKIDVRVEGGGATTNQYTGTYSTLQNAPTSRTVITIPKSELTDSTPNGEKRYFVKVEATVDSGETLYVGRPFVKME